MDYASTDRLARQEAEKGKMFRFLIRMMGLILLAAGFAALIIDGTRSIAASNIVVTKFGQTAFALFPKSFPILQPAVERHIHPLLWDPFLLAIFLAPTFAVLAVIGILLIWIVRRRRVTIGYSSRP